MKSENSLLPTSMKPLEDRLIIRPDKAPDEKKGIIIPEAYKEKHQPHRGTVVAAGPGKPPVSMPLKEGDRVMYGHFAGTLIEDPKTQEKLLIMRLADVFIKLHPGEEELQPDNLERRNNENEIEDNPQTKE